MSTNKAQFDSRDLSCPALNANSGSAGARKYAGPERRRRYRREGADRREEVRFELAGDRRGGPGRRKDDAPTSLW